MNAGDIGSGQQENMRLRDAFRRYAICLAIFVVPVILSFALNSWSSEVASFLFLMALVVYFPIGVYLNRNVLRRVIEWHPMYNTLENVTQSKMKFFGLWPFA